MNMMKSRPRRQWSKLAVVSAALVAAGGLAACSSGGGSAAAGGGGGGGGSATSGNITWWGWTPTTVGAATYIKAFNKVYPNIHVTFKEITIAGWDAALRPALAAAGVGPDVFDIAPGAGLAEYGTDAVNLAPAVAKVLGPDWKSKLALIGPTGLTTTGGSLAALPIGSTFAGNLWINQGLFTKYGLTPADHPGQLGARLLGVQGAQRRLLRAGRRAGRV